MNPIVEAIAKSLTDDLRALGLQCHNLDYEVGSKVIVSHYLRRERLFDDTIAIIYVASQKSICVKAGWAIKTHMNDEVWFNYELSHPDCFKLVVQKVSELANNVLRRHSAVL